MKQILLAAGIGLAIITMSMSSGTHHFISSANEDMGYYNDTIPKRDTTKPKKHPKPKKDTMHRPRPDTMQVVQ